MSSEYLRRYNRKFIAFHNPIELPENISRSNLQINNGEAFKILYVGRIGTANEHSIHFFANTISNCIYENYNIQFDIYTPDFDSEKSKLIANLKNIAVLPPVEHKAVPGLLKQYNLLLLPLDFTERGKKFAQYSIPTKASEYMISGTPILVFAPAETAVSSFFRYHECGYCLAQQSEQAIRDALLVLINNKEYRNRISNNSVKVAAKLFNATEVREKFQDLLRKLAFAEI